MVGSAVPIFDRSPGPEQYVQALAHAHAAGYRIYDPSHALTIDPWVEEKMLRWPPFVTAFQLRWANIAGRRWTVVPSDESNEKERALSKIVAKAMASIENFTEARINLASADLSGARYAERVRRTITATYGDGKPRKWVVPVQYVDMDKRNFRWDPVGQDRPERTLKYAVKRKGTVIWEDVPETAPLVVHRIGSREDSLGYGRGLREALVFIYTAAARVFEADVQGAERFGHGWVVMTLKQDATGSPTVTNTALQQSALAAMNKFRQNHNWVIGDGDDLKMLAPPSGAAEFMSGVAQRLETMGDRLILAGVLYAGGGGADAAGSRARAETESDTASVVFDVLAEQLEETLTRHEVCAFVADNKENLEAMGLAGVDHPRFAIERGRKQDPKAVADRVEVVLRSGIALKASEVYDGIGFSQPGEGDDVIKPQAQMPSFGGIGAPESDAQRRPAGGAEQIEDTALNGAQVTALQGLIEAVSARTMDPEAAMLAARSAFPAIPEDRIRRMFSAAMRVEPPAPPTAVVPSAGTPPAEKEAEANA